MLPPSERASHVRQKCCIVAARALFHALALREFSDFSRSPPNKCRSVQQRTSCGPQRGPGAQTRQIGPCAIICLNSPLESSFFSFLSSIYPPSLSIGFVLSICPPSPQLCQSAIKSSSNRSISCVRGKIYVKKSVYSIATSQEVVAPRCL